MNYTKFRTAAGSPGSHDPVLDNKCQTGRVPGCEMGLSSPGPRVDPEEGREGPRYGRQEEKKCIARKCERSGLDLYFFEEYVHVPNMCIYIVPKICCCACSTSTGNPQKSSQAENGMDETQCR